MPFLSALTLIFITLKLIGIITWSWLWVLAPLWIPLAVASVLVLFLILVDMLSGRAPKIRIKGRR